ncbi:MAG: short-chain dehydrogenase [Gammaproteobacteria bacterium]|nr:MAG: short-chain dehydrogenase [Gammaproteobacteria bacterium]
MSITLDFVDKTVLVIGGTSGINRGIASLFAEHGARVAVASRSQEKVDDTVASLKNLGAQSMGFTVDVRDAEAVKKGVMEVHENYGELDVVVSGAAGNFVATAMGMSANGFRAVVDIDLMGTFHVMQAVYPCLKKPGASVINISAPQAFIPMEAQSHVCAAKAGVDMLTRTLAMEWGPEGIRVNSIVPGPIENTEGMKRLAPSAEILEQVKESVPLKRLGSTEDIGNACLFLGSPMGDYINGAVIPVDGGWSQNGTGVMRSALSDFAQGTVK